MSEKLTCADVKRNSQAIRLRTQKREQRRTLPEEELFSSFVAYSHILSCPERVCFAISTQMPASTVYTWAKTTNRLNFSLAKLCKITCELFSRFSILLGLFQNENTRKRIKMRSFEWHSNSRMNDILFWSFRPRRWNEQNHSENGLFGRTE